MVDEVVPVKVSFLRELPVTDLAMVWPDAVVHPRMVKHAPDLCKRFITAMEFSGVGLGAFSKPIKAGVLFDELVLLEKDFIQFLFGHRNVIDVAEVAEISV